jgi:hypothetical protein
MSLFGSRENDPLLQDDPFAPSDEDPPADAEDETGADASGGDASPVDEPAPTTRTITYTRQEARAGDLTELNRALDREWRLDSIRLEGDNALQLTLRRTQGGPDAGSII